MLAKLLYIVQSTEFEIFTQTSHSMMAIMDSFPVPTAYYLQGNDDCEVLKLKSRTCKDLLHQIPKPSRPYFAFKYFPGPGEMDNFLKDFQGSVATQCIYAPQSGDVSCCPFLPYRVASRQLTDRVDVHSYSYSVVEKIPVFPVVNSRRSVDIRMRPCMTGWLSDRQVARSAASRRSARLHSGPENRILNNRSNPV